MTITVHPVSLCLRGIDQNLPAVLKGFPSAPLKLNIGFEENYLVRYSKKKREKKGMQL